MKLQVYTGRIHDHRDDPDKVDITWLGTKGTSVFAPKPELFYPMIALRRRGELTDQDWVQYRDAYITQMRECYKTHREIWEVLLSRDRVVLVCFCADSTRCHRSLLAHLLARCGAVNCGELGRTSPQLGLQLDTKGVHRGDLDRTSRNS